MTIGMDISPLQGPHRMRGIGAVVINFINNISKTDRKQHSFVFYMKPDEETRKDALELLQLSNLKYEVRDKPPIKNPEPVKLPGRLLLLGKLINKIIAIPRFRQGIPGFDSSGIDVYLHTDQMLGMPYMPRIKKVLVAYDLIPYILEWDYLWSYKTARRYGLGRKGALAAAARRRTYINKVKINVRKSKKVIAISKQTKADFIKYAGAKKTKVEVVYLGVNRLDSAELIPPTYKYVASSWGYFKKPFKFDTNTPFILYVGGTDHRRKLDHLVAAFNHLRAQGHDLKLILTGDILQGPKNLPVKDSREALLNSSYSKDIIYLGFVDEATKNWLYKHALAFVYPSMYEGFGLPILEAMANGSPVVTYKNSSISEVSGRAIICTEGYIDIIKAIRELLMTKSAREKYKLLGYKQAEKFDWGKSVSSIISLLTTF